jgi:hypothetical protein
MSAVFSARDKADCAAREVKQRQRVYARLVGEGRMKGDEADRQIALMEEIAVEYRAIADAQDAQGTLL